MSEEEEALLLLLVQQGSNHAPQAPPLQLGPAHQLPHIPTITGGPRNTDAKDNLVFTSVEEPAPPPLTTPAQNLPILAASVTASNEKLKN